MEAELRDLRRLDERSRARIAELERFLDDIDAAHEQRDAVLDEWEGWADSRDRLIAMEVDLRTEPLVKQLADLRRRYGTGQGRGHPPSYAPAQAARVRDLRAQGMSIREIERAVNLSHGTVQRIIAKTATAPVPGPTREERHAARMRRADDKRLRSWPERMDAANAAVEEAEQTALRSRRRER